MNENQRNNIHSMFGKLLAAEELRTKDKAAVEGKAFNELMTAYNDAATAMNKDLPEGLRSFPHWNGKNLDELLDRAAEPINAPKVAGNGFKTPDGSINKETREKAERIEVTSTLGVHDYRSLHYRNPNKVLDMGDFNSSKEFWDVLNSGKFDPRLPEKRIMSTGSLASGGVLMPEAIVADVFDIGNGNDLLRPLMKNWSFGDGDAIKIPQMNSYDKQGGKTVAGWVPVFLGEGATGTAQDPTFNYVEMQAKWLTLFCNASIQLAFAPNFDQMIMGSMKEAVNETMEDVFINGNGVGRGTGLLNSASKIEVARDTTGAIGYTDLVNLYAKIYSKNLANAVFLTNPDTLTDLLTLTTPGGNAPAIVIERADGQFTLFGKRVLFSDQVPTLGETGDIMLVDPSQMNCAFKREMLIDRSNAVEFYKSLISYRVLVGFDCRSSWVSTVTTPQGVEKSWLAVLSA